MTLAELKRDADKYTWKLVQYEWHGEEKFHPCMNIVRSVKIKQTNSIMFDDESWLEFGKSKEFTFVMDDNKLSAVRINHGFYLLVYELELIDKREDLLTFKLKRATKKDHAHTDVFVKDKYIGYYIKNKTYDGSQYGFNFCSDNYKLIDSFGFMTKSQLIKELINRLLATTECFND